MPSKYSLLLLFASVFITSTAAAQLELTGTYIRYLAISPSGTMVCSTCGGHSMQYGETTTDTPACDAFFPGAPQESFTLEGTAGGTTRVTNSGPAGGSFTTTGATAISGRSITWSGTATIGTTTVRVDQTHAFEMDDRFVRVTVVVTNTGATALTDVYYLRNADPDHGACGIGFNSATGNDVLRQPPGDDSALTIAIGGDGTSPSRTVVLGIGAHDARARVHNGGFANVDASGEWNSPMDHAGMLGDEGVDIIFREPMIAAGGSTTFEFFYVWGLSRTDVESRFDEVGFPAAPCVGLAEGAACTTGRGAMGLCRGGRCCTGCWNGTRCQLGASPAACGAGGATCSDCSDRMFCTLDSCTAGVCSSAPSPTICNDEMSCTSDVCVEATDSCTFTFVGGCIIGGMCVGAGTTNPTYPCQVCDPDRDSTDWSTKAEGEECGGILCAAGRLRDRACSAEGVCEFGPTSRCPTGACADSTTCAPPCDATTCEEDEWCNPTLMRCEPISSLGGRCSAPMGCSEGFCVDGVCCETECLGTCESCDQDGVEGACTPIPEGTDPDDECGSECDGAGLCLPGPDAGPGDAGALDAGAPDAGDLPDGGPAAFDAGAPLDAGGEPPPEDDGCGCSANGTENYAAFVWLAVVALGLRRRSRRATR